MLRTETLSRTLIPPLPRPIEVKFSLMILRGHLKVGKLAFATVCLLSLLVVVFSNYLPPSVSVHPPPAVICCVLSSAGRGAFRAAWRKFQCRLLAEAGIEVRFFLDKQTPEGEVESRTYGDVTFLPNASLPGDFHLRTFQAFDWAFRQHNKYMWFIRADDDSVWCGSHLASKIKVLEEKIPNCGIHWGHYIYHDHFGKEVSDCAGVYNRLAVQEWLVASQSAPGFGGLYLDLVDTNRNVVVVKDVRFSFGGRSQGSVSYKDGWIDFSAMSPCVLSRFCRDYFSLHLNIKADSARGIETISKITSCSLELENCNLPPPPDWIIKMDAKCA